MSNSRSRDIKYLLNDSLSDIDEDNVDIEFGPNIGPNTGGGRRGCLGGISQVVVTFSLVNFFVLQQHP